MTAMVRSNLSALSLTRRPVLSGMFGFLFAGAAISLTAINAVATGGVFAAGIILSLTALWVGAVLRQAGRPGIRSFATGMAIAGGAGLTIMMAGFILG